jgi:hypothetical protein
VAEIKRQSPGNSELPSSLNQWSAESRRELIEFYVDGMDVRLMAKYFATSSHEVIGELASLVLGASRVSRNHLSPRYGERSSWRDHDVLVEQYRWGASVQVIAKVLQRDELAVAYRILERLTPQIPAQTLELLGLENMAEQKRQAEGVDEGSDETRICSDCRDVILYCTCQIEGGRFF